MKDPRLGVYKYLYKNYGITNDKITQNIADTQRLLNKLENDFIAAKIDYNSAAPRTRSGKQVSSAVLIPRIKPVGIEPRRSLRFKTSHPYGGRKSKRNRKNNC